MALRFEIFH